MQSNKETMIIFKWRKYKKKTNIYLSIHLRLKFLVWAILIEVLHAMRVCMCIYSCVIATGTFHMAI